MAEQRYFPTIPTSHWQNLRIQFKKSIPGSITTNYLASILNMSEASAGANVLPGLRNIGLVDAENKTNQDLAKKFRDDNAYPAFCQEIIKKCYPQELIDAFPDKDSDKDKVRTWFMNHTGSGESAASKLSSFYITLLEADPVINVRSGSATKKETNNRPKQEKPKNNKSINDAKDSSQGQDVLGDKHIPQAGRNNTPDLNINIQIHISSDASPDQIKSIFENMAKYLYKN